MRAWMSGSESYAMWWELFSWNWAWRGIGVRMGIRGIGLAGHTFSAGLVAWGQGAGRKVLAR